MDMLGADELDAVLACLQNREACAAAPAVCRAWRTAAAHCSGLLPPLRPAPGLELAWLQQHAGRLAKLTLRRVADLGGVQRLSRLQALRLESCPLLEDLSPLAALPALRSLALSSCRSVGNLGVVAHLTGLTRLALDRCLTRDLGVLCGHPSLSELAIAYDVWVAVGLVFPTQLPALTRMRIMAEIQDMEPLCRFPSLASLEVYAVSIFDLQPLSRLTGLTELVLHQLQDDGPAGGGVAAPLRSLSQLRRLSLPGCDGDVIAAAPWAALAGSLSALDLHGSYVSDLAPLACLSGLQELSLAQAKLLRDVGPCAALAGLCRLDLSGCSSVRDLRPVLHLLRAGGLLRP